MNIIKIDLENNLTKHVKKAASILKSDGVIIYPTDTSYGLGVNAFSEIAINKLYRLKKRSHSKPTHVVVRNWAMIKNICFVNDTVKRVFDTFLPGPLTIVLKKKPIVPDALTGGLNTVGIRIPNNNFTKQLSKHLPFAYSTTSANQTGKQTPYNLSTLKRVVDLKNIDAVFYAGQLKTTPPSTIVDMSDNKLSLLRKGPVDFDYIKSII